MRTETTAIQAKFLQLELRFSAICKNRIKGLTFWVHHKPRSIVHFLKNFFLGSILIIFLLFLYKHSKFLLGPNSISQRVQKEPLVEVDCINYYYSETESVLV